MGQPGFGISCAVRRSLNWSIDICLHPPMSQAPNSPSVVSDNARTTGPLFIGYTFNWALYGALCVQTYIYYVSFPKDPILSKFLIYLLLALETLQTVLFTVDLFDIFATSYGQIDVLNNVHCLWFSVPIMTGLIGGIVQLFYCYRISILSRSRVLAASIGAISLAQFVAAVIEGHLQYTYGLYSKQSRQNSLVPCLVWLAGSALCDIIIATIQTYYLIKIDASYKATRNMITRLVRITIETGVLTAAAATVVALFLVTDTRMYNTAPAFCLGKLYTNALLMVFNSRARYQSRRDQATNAGMFFARNPDVGGDTSFSSPEQLDTYNSTFTLDRPISPAQIQQDAQPSPSPQKFDIPPIKSRSLSSSTSQPSPLKEHFDIRSTRHYTLRRSKETMCTFDSSLESFSFPPGVSRERSRDRPNTTDSCSPLIARNERPFFGPGSSEGGCAGTSESSSPKADAFTISPPRKPNVSYRGLAERPRTRFPRTSSLSPQDSPILQYMDIPHAI
ncbi:uncharacterized protein BT62DRAFT_65335 [Guyanagaster necrorhizus]|uniref:DUF6534 domain-containing protein n=1 Tax=Guyanagaster necrorhizus TaxID=856835 RepID=A0A9P7VUY2_9AGAR|nr:uncharacterized protein BT62DRAFT_65335 [Guyanagaster necrorhizus MCA 3950]KAG7447175.1 hypothetical protein BT62DRAFT_65335 [Guyanagaster necrorhizus MCA 3950]